MAKKAKVRKVNKTPTRVGSFSKKHIDRVTSLISHKIWIAGSNFMTEVHVAGIEEAKLHVTGARLGYELVDAVNVNIRKVRRNWQFLYFVFSKDENGENVFSYDVAEVKNANAVELDRATSSLIRDKVDEMNDDNAISYAWVAFPNETVDVDAMVLDYEQFFAERGCYDIEKRSAVVLSRKLEGLNTKRLAEDYREIYCKIQDEYPIAATIDLDGERCNFKQTTERGEVGFTVMLKEPSMFMRWIPRTKHDEKLFITWVKHRVNTRSAIKASDNLETFFSQFRINPMHIDAFTLNIGN